MKRSRKPYGIAVAILVIVLIILFSTSSHKVQAQPEHMGENITTTTAEKKLPSKLCKRSDPQFGGDTSLECSDTDYVAHYEFFLQSEAVANVIDQYQLTQQALNNSFVYRSGDVDKTARIMAADASNNLVINITSETYSTDKLEKLIDSV
jgi:hypothetical protein